MAGFPSSAGPDPPGSAGPDPPGSAGPDPVTTARRLADGLLFPEAATTDASEVTVGALDALAGAGLYGLAGPREWGGLGAEPAVFRAVAAALAGGCGSTSFVWAQHHTPLRLLVSSPSDPLRRRWLPRLCRGTERAGVAFAHLRRPGPPAVRVRRDGGAWRLDGEAPWVTGWGLVSVLAVAGLTADEEVVWLLVPLDPPPPGLAAGPPLRLAAMQATRTVRVSFDGCRLEDSLVVDRLSLTDWRRADRVTTAVPPPAAFGLADRAIRLLPEPAAVPLAAELSACVLHAEALVDQPAAGAGQADLVDARAWALDLAFRAATAVVTETGGRGMLSDHPGQRLVREATFYLIQAQTAEGRAATRRRLVGRGGPT